jgi:hypothetical protein
VDIAPPGWCRVRQLFRVTEKRLSRAAAIWAGDPERASIEPRDP